MGISHFSRAFNWVRGNYRYVVAWLNCRISSESGLVVLGLNGGRSYASTS